MTYSHAMHEYIQDIPTKELFNAVKAIGAEKLSIRIEAYEMSGHIEGIYPILRAMNVRIDALLAELDARTNRNRKAA